MNSNYRCSLFYLLHSFVFNINRFNNNLFIVNMLNTQYIVTIEIEILSGFQSVICQCNVSLWIKFIGFTLFLSSVFRVLFIMKQATFQAHSHGKMAVLLNFV